MVRKVAVDAHAVAVLAWRDPDVAAASALSIAADADNAVEGPAALVDGDGDGVAAQIVRAEKNLVAVDVVGAVKPSKGCELVSLVGVAEARGGVLDVGDGDSGTAAESDVLTGEAVVMADELTHRCRCSLRCGILGLPC